MMPSAGNQKGPGHMAQHLTQNGGNRKKSKAPLVLLTILLVLIVLGSVGFFLVKGGAFNNIGLFQQKNQTDAETTEVVEEEASEKKSMPMTPFTVLLKAGEISSIRVTASRRALAPMATRTQTSHSRPPLSTTTAEGPSTLRLRRQRPVGPTPSGRGPTVTTSTASSTPASTATS